MNEPVIIDFIRTPIGRYGGVLKDMRPDDLAASVIVELMRRNAVVSGQDIEDVYIGCANQAGEDNRNVARMALLLAGMPATVGGCTVNRLCASSMDAVACAARSIISGAGDIFIAGGVESMTRAPYVMGKSEQSFARGDIQVYDTTLGWRFTNSKLAKMHYPYSMGETAENVAEKYKISRKRQDEFALASQSKYASAETAGFFADEIMPVSIPQRDGVKIITQDEHPRRQTTPADLQKLKPAFREDGTVTAGNSSGINDGAGAMLIMSAKKAASLGLKPLAKILGLAVAGVDPAYMGTGPIPACQKILSRSNLSINDIDLFELNEAFAAQVLACTDELKINHTKLNVNGGAIAIGHPLGASGVRIIGTLMRALQARHLRYGLASMCIGVGQGMATLVEMMD